MVEEGRVVCCWVESEDKNNAVVVALLLLCPVGNERTATADAFLVIDSI